MVMPGNDVEPNALMPRLLRGEGLIDCAVYFFSQDSQDFYHTQVGTQILSIGD